MKTGSANVEPKIYDLRAPKKSKDSLETEKEKDDKEGLMKQTDLKKLSYLHGICPLSQDKDKYS